MATYVAVTGTFSSPTGHNWQPVGYGTTREAALADAEQALGTLRVGDIYSETEHKNLRVLSLSDAKRRGYFSREARPLVCADGSLTVFDPRDPGDEYE